MFAYFPTACPKNPRNTLVFLQFFEHTDKKSDSPFCANDLISVFLGMSIRCTTSWLSCVSTYARETRRKIYYGSRTKTSPLATNQSLMKWWLQFTAGLQTNPAPATGYTADWVMLQRSLQKHSTPQRKESLKAKKPPQKSIDTVAREVINGKWGNGADRKKRLTKAGYDYNAVKKRVNEIFE